MSNKKVPFAVADQEKRRRRSTAESSEIQMDHEARVHRRSIHCDRLCVGSPHLDVADTLSPLIPDPSHPHHSCQYTPKTLALHRGQVAISSGRSTPSQFGEDAWHDTTVRTTIRADNEVEAQKEANNYKFGFRKWKSHVTERPMEDRSDIVRELYSELNFIRPHSGSVITCGNVAYVFLFGWWVSLIYFLVCFVMFLTIMGSPYGVLCWRLACYFIWPFGKSVQKTNSAMRRCCMKFPNCEAIPEGDCEDEEVTVLPESTPLVKSLPAAVDIPAHSQHTKHYWRRVSTYVWLLLGYPVLALAHGLACFLSWLLVFTIPVAKVNARMLGTILLMAPEDVHIRSHRKVVGCETRALLCCYNAFNLYYYKYSVYGINVFAVNLLPLVIITLAIGYIDTDNQFVSSEIKFATALTSIIPLSYYIGMGIASISAQSNFAVGAVVNATFGSITELTFYITALLRGQREGSKCYEEIVKSALTGTLLGCILFIPGICMVIGGLKHREQRFNSRSAGVSSALLFISIGGVFAPTLFSKAYGSLVCERCNSTPANISGPFVCQDCHYGVVGTAWGPLAPSPSPAYKPPIKDLCSLRWRRHTKSENNQALYLSHIEPLVYTISVLLPAAYLIGLVFTLKTHSHIYDIHISDVYGHGQEALEGVNLHGGIVHWSRWMAMGVLILATLLMAACADLTTEHIKPILDNSKVSQYFIGVTVLAMIPELPEIMNGVQFALLNNISLSLEVGSCLAVQVCMIQIPLVILFNAFYDVGFVLIFSDLHLWASIFSVILVNYIFMDGKCDYFQGTALVVVYLILLSVYFFAPSPTSC